MGLFKRNEAAGELPQAVTKALDLAKGERVLAFGVDDNTGAYLVATTFALAVVKPVGMTASSAMTDAATADAARADAARAGVATAGATTTDATTTDAARADLTALRAERLLRRRWLSVDAGAWEPETGTLTVTWADGSRAGQWSFRHQQTLLPETVRERVQASVVLATRLTLGDKRTGRVAIRQDFATRELIPQTILGRHARADDPEVEAHVQAALAHLRDQVGLPA